MRRYRVSENGHEYLVTEAPASIGEALELAKRNFDSLAYEPKESTYWIDLVVYEDHWDEEAGRWRQVAEAVCPMAIFPLEPPCTSRDGLHWWCTPRELPRVGTFPHGDGFRFVDVCAYCGLYKVIDTWATNPEDGREGLLSVEFMEPDEASVEWMSRRKKEASDV